MIEIDSANEESKILCQRMDFPSAKHWLSVNILMVVK
jgi:hypothetical protein